MNHHKHAFPAQPVFQYPDGSRLSYNQDGLTKRELLAAMAMQGLLSNLAALRHEGFRDHEIEEFAIMRADGLIAALERMVPTYQVDR